MHEIASRPTSSIVAAAAALLLVSAGLFCLSAWYLHATYYRSGSMRQVLVGAQAPTVFLFDVMPIFVLAFSLLGIVTSLELFRLRERARTAVIILCVVALAGPIFAMTLFLAAANDRGRAAINAAYGLFIYGALFLCMLPFSIWWLVLFSRQNVRSQFH